MAPVLLPPGWRAAVAARRRCSAHPSNVFCTKEKPMKKNMVPVAAMFAAVVALATCAPALATQDRATGAAADAHAKSDMKGKGGVSEYDRHFVEETASGGMLEVDLGKMAAEKSQSADVKAFAHHMVADHSKANEKLKTLAASKGIAIPKELQAEHKAKHDQLSKLSGEDFDRRYMNEMVKAHEATVTKFEHETRTGSDDDIKQFAKDTLPTLREHLGQAQKVDKETDAAASADQK
jgi:putative membrane protein